MDGLHSRLGVLDKLQWMGRVLPPITLPKEKNMEPENYQVMKKKIYAVSHLFTFNIYIYHLYLDDNYDCST